MSITDMACDLKLKKTDSAWTWKWPLWHYSLPYMKASFFNVEYIKR